MKPLSVLAGLALAAVGWCAGEAAWTIRQARPKVLVTISNVDRVAIVAGVAATEIQKGAAEWEKASKLQALESTSVLTATKDSLVSMQTDVHSVAVSANSLLLLTSKAIDHQDQSLLQTQTALQGTLKDVSQTAQESQMVLVDADKVIADPALKQSVDNLATASQSVASATEHADKSMAKVEQGVTYEVNELMKPVNKAKAAALILVQFIGKLYGF